MEISYYNTNQGIFKGNCRTANCTSDGVWGRKSPSGIKRRSCGATVDGLGDIVSQNSIFEILRSKRIGVTSLTFQGHATSSVT